MTHTDLTEREMNDIMRVDVRKLYEDDSWGWFSYDPMIEAFGDVAIRVDAGSYQGDTYVLYEDNGKFGYLTFGWGSCSGCDALQACGSLREVQRLCDSLQNSIMWFGTKAEALEWFKTHDWKGDWCWWNGVSEFVDKVIAYLSKEN